MRLASLLTLYLLFAPGVRKNAVPEPLILGDWCAGSKSAYHEEFSLTIEEGSRLFSSWLHQRPAESGTWELRYRTLTIHGSSEQSYTYTVLRASSSRLVLQEDGDPPETYVRAGAGCREFEGVKSEDQ